MYMFDGVQEALKRHWKQRKKALDRARSDCQKKRRIELKVKRTKESHRRIKWTKVHGQDTYSQEDDDLEHDLEVVNEAIKEKKVSERKCSACGSSTHLCSNHKDCPFKKAVSGVSLTQKED